MPPRPLRSKDDPDSSDVAASFSEPKASKRRAISSACIPCRKRKSKCDGNVPSCSTCIAVYRTDCSYEADSDHRRKGALKRDIQSLQQQNDALDVIVASLQNLPENEAIDLLRSMRGDSSLDVLAASLRTDVRLPNSYAPQTLEADFAQQISQSYASGTSRGTSLPRRQSSAESEYLSSTVSPEPGTGGWFRTPQDPEFVQHLLNLYFTWIHPFYHFFSRETFLQDMASCRTEHCSPMLVNAVLAFACHYSDRQAARTDSSNPVTAGDDFYAEAKRQLDMSDKSCLTTVQALGVMSARECSHGRDSNGYQLAGRCLRMALELGLHLSVSGSGLRTTDLEVRKMTFWGVFNLETVCSVEFGRLSQLPRVAADIPKPSATEESEAAIWRPYEDNITRWNQATEQSAHSILFVDYLSRLSEMASDMVNTFFAPQERCTSRRLAMMYAGFQEWYRGLPDIFQLNNTSLPHVLVLHMYYYACVLHLFRPYIKLDLSGAGLFPRDACSFCANQISIIMNSLRGIYGLRRVTLAVPSLLLSASTIHLLNLPAEPAATHLDQALSDLHAISVNHQFAGRCVEIIRSLAVKWNIMLPESVTAGVASWNKAAITRSKLHSPTSSTFFAASLPKRKTSSGTGTRSDQQSCNISEGPFQPPKSAPPNQQYMGFTNSPPKSEDSTGITYATLWTPFPLQGAPLDPDVFSEMMLDFSRVDSTTSTEQHWPAYITALPGQTSDPSSTTAQQQDSDGIGESIGDGVGSWSWHQ